MDFSKIDFSALAEDGTEMVLCYPGTKIAVLDEKGEYAWFGIRGPNSPIAKSYLKENQRRLLGKSATTVDEEKNAIGLSVAVVSSVNNLEWQGKAVTMKELPEFLANHIFLCGQISEAFANGDNFLPKTPRG